jgi:hypothetical protein
MKIKEYIIISQTSHSYSPKSIIKYHYFYLKNSVDYIVMMTEYLDLKKFKDE